MSIRNERSNAVISALEGINGWVSNPFDSSHTAAEWRNRFPNLPLVADGREVTGYTKKGRGTTAFDLFRTVESRGFLRTDFLSVKTERMEHGTFPNRLDLSTGNVETLDGLLQGIRNGASLPTLIFSSSGEDGMIDESGYALFIDLAPVLRGNIPDPVEGGYRKGEAPEAYFRWSAARPCGGKSKHLARTENVFPYIDERGRRWVAPDKVTYRELVVSLSKCGIRREDWMECTIRSLPGMLERVNWDEISLGI